MPWVKLDDHFDQHPKVTDVGALGLALQVAALCYCARGLTDGHLSRRGARRLIDADEYGIDMTDLIADLIAHGIWHDIGHECPRCPQPARGSYYVHDYLQLQPSREQHEAGIEQRRLAGKKGGRSRATNHSDPHNTPKGGSEPSSGPLTGSPSGSPSGVLSEIPSPSPESRFPYFDPETRSSSTPQPPSAGGRDDEEDSADAVKPTGTLRRRIVGDRPPPPIGWTPASYTAVAIDDIVNAPTLTDRVTGWSLVLAEHLAELSGDDVGPKGVEALKRLIQRYPVATVLEHLDRAIADPDVVKPIGYARTTLADKETSTT